MKDITRVFHFYNRFHTGDNLLNLKFLLYITPVLKANNIVIHYYYDDKWAYNKSSTLQSYIDPAVVQLKPLQEKPSNSIELWMGHPMNGAVWYGDSELYFDNFYKNILKHLDIKDPSIVTNLWLDEPFLLSVYEQLDPIYKEVDILIMNNISRSCLYNDNSLLNDLVRHLDKRFNIVVSESVDNVKSAQELSLQQIGAISTHAKYIISTCSGPHIPCFNQYTKRSVKKWFLVTDGLRLLYPSIDCVHVIKDVTPIRQFFDAL